MVRKSGRQFYGMDVRGIRIILQDELCVFQDFGCESAGDTINTAMVGWCGGTSSPPVFQVESVYFFDIVSKLDSRYAIKSDAKKRVWIAWTHIPLETVDRWFKSGKTQPLF